MKDLNLYARMDIIRTKKPTKKKLINQYDLKNISAANTEKS